jgi:hypothetical protein
MFCCVAAFAQESRFTFEGGGGFTNPAYDLDGRLKTGWNFLAGAGVNIRPNLGVVAEFNFNDMGISDRQLTSLNMPDGSTRIYSGSINPVVRLGARGPVSFYLKGGPGIYHRTVEFTQPTVSTITVFDPWWGVFYPANVATNEILASYGTTKFGLNGGGGIEVRLGQGNAKFFAEARYHHMYTQPIATTYVPVTFGFRW